MKKKMDKYTVNGSRKRLAAHYGMTQSAFKDYMGKYKPPKATPRVLGGATKAETRMSRTMKY